MPDYQRFVGMCCSLCLFPLSARWTWSLLVFWFSLCMNVTCTSYLLNFAFPRKLKKQFLPIVVWQTALNIFICHTNAILTKLFQNFLLGQDSKMLQYTDFSAREKTNGNNSSPCHWRGKKMSPFQDFHYGVFPWRFISKPSNYDSRTSTFLSFIIPISLFLPFDGIVDGQTSHFSHPNCQLSCAIHSGEIRINSTFINRYSLFDI